MNRDLHTDKLDLEKAEEPEIKSPTSLDHPKSKKIEKNIYFCFIDYAKAIVWITTNCGKLFKSLEYQTTLPASWEMCMQVKKQQSELEIEQWTGSKLEKEYVKAVYCHPAIWLICRAHQAKCWAGGSTNWNKIARRNINNFRYSDDTTLMAEREEELENLLSKVKEESEKFSILS